MGMSDEGNVMGHPVKKPINVSINSELLAQARELKINLSATLEGALIEAIGRRQRDLWRQDNQAAITAYNDLVEAKSVFGDNLRSF